MTHLTLNRQFKPNVGSRFLTHAPATKAFALDHILIGMFQQGKKKWNRKELTLALTEAYKIIHQGSNSKYNRPRRDAQKWIRKGINQGLLIEVSDYDLLFG